MRIQKFYQILLSDFLNQFAQELLSNWKYCWMINLTWKGKKQHEKQPPSFLFQYDFNDKS